MTKISMLGGMTSKLSITYCLGWASCRSITQTHEFTDMVILQDCFISMWTHLKRLRKQHQFRITTPDWHSTIKWKITWNNWLIVSSYEGCLPTIIIYLNIHSQSIKNPRRKTKTQQSHCLCWPLQYFYQTDQILKSFFSLLHKIKAISNQ